MTGMSDAALYGFCEVCRAPRTVQYTKDDDGTVLMSMVCSADPAHDQDSVDLDDL